VAFGPIKSERTVSDTKIIELFEQWTAADTAIAAWTQFEDEQAKAKFEAFCDHADELVYAIADLPATGAAGLRHQGLSVQVGGVRD
jgi:hypothetical protein